MRFLWASIFLLIFFAFPANVLAASNQFVIIVNPIRGDDFFSLSGSKPVDNFKKELEVIKKDNLAATWLVRPDALANSEITAELKSLPASHEIGLFMEVTPTWAKLAGVNYHQSANWHSSGAVFLTGYSVEERHKLIDTAFDTFKKNFSLYPKSVGAWWIDAGSLSYMRDKFGVVANMDVADQYTTDNYQIWGQFFSTPFYPSKRNALTVASGPEQKIGLVTIQWATRDPFNAYGNGVLDSTYSVQANDYANQKFHTLGIDYFQKLLDIYLNNSNSSFGQVTVGMENDFSWGEFGDEYSKQIDEVGKRQRSGTAVLTMSNFASRYFGLFPKVTPSKTIFADDPLGSGGKVVWYQTLKYRVGWFYNSSGSVIRDLRIFRESLDEPCLEKACPELNLAMLETRNLDEVTFGDKWIIDEGKISDVKVRNLENGLEISYKNQTGQSRLITFLPNDVVIDKTSVPVDVAIAQAINNSRNLTKIEGNFNYSLKDSLQNVLATQFKNLGLFLVFALLAFYLPGLAILRKSNLDDRAKFILSFPVGIALFTLLSFILEYLHFRLALFLLPVLALILLKGRVVLPRPNWINFPVALLTLFGSISWLLVTVKNGLVYDFGLAFWGPHGHDGIWHLSLIESLKQGLPLQNPIFAATNLGNYHFFYDLLLAESSNLTKISSLDLYFRMFPFLISLLIGAVGYILVKSWFKSKLAGFFAVFFVYFGGSFGWTINFLKDRTFGGETLFWAQQGISTFINPPFAISVLALLTGLFLFNRVREDKDYNIGAIVPLVIIWGTLIEFKAYGGLLVLGSLAAVTAYELIKGNFKFLKISLPIGILSLAVFLPNNSGSSTLLVFQPLWLIHSMVDSVDRLNFIRLSQARIAGEDGGNYLKFIAAEIVGTVIFILGNLGTRIVGVLALRNNLFILAFLFLSVVVPLLFIQKGAAFNIVQFFYYFLLVSSLLAGAGLALFVKRLGALGWVIAVIILLATLPTTYNTLGQYLPPRPPSAISQGELEGLNFLKQQPTGMVLGFYFDKKIHDRYSAPIPLFAYESTAYVSAISNRPEFIADTVNLEILGVDYKGRYQIQKDIFAMREPELLKKLVKDNNITYIYAPKISNFDPNEEKFGLKKIFSNKEVDIFKVL
jgi:hypothetical protein